MNTMFDTLLQLPLFQGLTQEDLTSILGKVKLHFDRHKPGETLLKRGMPCNQLLFVLKGEISAYTPAADGTYAVTEQMQAPCLIEPHSLFGMHTTYASTYTTLGEVHTVSISKTFALNELSKYEIFRLNYMNIISNRAQTLSNRLWDSTPKTLRERIGRFILTHTERPAGWKSMKIKMEVMAQIVNDTRNGVSKVLNDMQEEGIVELHRGEIFIPDAARLEAALHA